MVFVDLDRWPEVVVRKEAGRDRIAENAVPLMQRIIDLHYLYLRLRAASRDGPHPVWNW